MSTKTKYVFSILIILLVLISFQPSSIVYASNPACDAAKQIEQLISLVANPPQYLSRAVLAYEKNFFAISVDLDPTLNAWLQKVGSSIKTRTDLINALKAAGWKHLGTDPLLGRENWIKPSDWKDPCAGGGGGGSSLQFSANYIWLLILMAILAMIAVSLTGGSLLPA